MIIRNVIEKEYKEHGLAHLREPCFFRGKLVNNGYNNDSNIMEL